jgi:hypothetical protein
LVFLNIHELPTANGINPFEPIGVAGCGVEVEQEKNITEIETERKILFMLHIIFSKAKYQMY